jgi:hypothetical protein
MNHGSPFWQITIFGIAAVYLLWETYRGWRNGVIRAGIQLAAIVVSSLLGICAANLAAAPLGGLGQFSGLVAGGIVGCGVGLVVFALILILGALLFKRTDHQRSGSVRLLWGAGGALCGFVLGLIILWGGISCVRALGALAHARSKASEPGGPPPSRIATGLVTMKESLELGPAGKIVEAADPVPSDFYDLIRQMGELSSSPEAVGRFLHYPGINALLANPTISRLLEDPAIARASQEGNAFALMTNQKLIAAVQDPLLAAQLSKIDLRAALKFALEKPSPSPSPSPKPPAKKK